MKAVKLLRRTVKCCAVIATAVKAVADEKCEDCDFCLVFKVHEQNLGYRVSESFPFAVAGLSIMGTISAVALSVAPWRIPLRTALV